MSLATSTKEKLDSVTSSGRVFHFTTPIEVDVACEADSWTYNHAATGLNGYGNSREQALESFAGDVAHSWNSYVLVPDGDLAHGALRLKRQLRELISVDRPR